MLWFTGRSIVVLAVVICLAARANAALGIAAHQPVHTRRPNECPHNSGYVANGDKIPLEFLIPLEPCREEVCNVEDGMYTFITYTCPPAPQLGPFCSRSAPNKNLPYPDCCPHAAPVSCI